jgi:hypothetical protein
MSYLCNTFLKVAICILLGDRIISTHILALNFQVSLLPTWCLVVHLIFLQPRLIIKLLFISSSHSTSKCQILRALIDLKCHITVVLICWSNVRILQASLGQLRQHRGRQHLQPGEDRPLPALLPVSRPQACVTAPLLHIRGTYTNGVKRLFSFFFFFNKRVYFFPRFTTYSHLNMASK